MKNLDNQSEVVYPTRGNSFQNLLLLLLANLLLSCILLLKFTYFVLLWFYYRYKNKTKLMFTVLTVRTINTFVNCCVWHKYCRSFNILLCLTQTKLLLITMLKTRKTDWVSVSFVIVFDCKYKLTRFVKWLQFQLNFMIS